MIARVAVVAVALFAGQAALVAAFAALRPRTNIYKAIIAIAIVTMPAAILSDRLLFGRTLAVDGRLFLGLMHLALGGFLFHFMTLPDRSVTLRILVELDLAPGRQLSLDALNRRYSVREMVASRLRQLAEGDFLTIGADGALTLKPRGVRFGRFVAGGRRLFRITSAN